MQGAALALRTVLALSYPFLAHAANASDDGDNRRIFASLRALSAHVEQHKTTG